MRLVSGASSSLSTAEPKRPVTADSRPKPARRPNPWSGPEGPPGMPAVKVKTAAVTRGPSVRIVPCRWIFQTVPTRPGPQVAPPRLQRRLPGHAKNAGCRLQAAERLRHGPVSATP